MAPKPLEPPSSNGAQSPPDPAPTLASSAKATPDSNPVGASPSPTLAESPKTTPPSPQSHGLGFAGGVPLDGDMLILSQKTFPSGPRELPRPLPMIQSS
jgi:hypothetical protein